MIRSERRRKGRGEEKERRKKREIFERMITSTETTLSIFEVFI